MEELFQKVANDKTEKETLGNLEGQGQHPGNERPRGKKNKCEEEIFKEIILYKFPRIKK